MTPHTSTEGHGSRAFWGVAGLALLVHLPLWLHADLWATDPYLHELRLVALGGCHADGVLWPHWLPDLAFGHGYALFHYYPPACIRPPPCLSSLASAPGTPSYWS
jgi:hypothetical protein